MPNPYSEADSLATPPPTLLTGVLARLEARRAAIDAPTNVTNATSPTDTPDQPSAPVTPSMTRLRQALTDPRWEVRAAAARALGALADGNDASDAAMIGQAYTSIMAPLDDEHRLVRAASVRALARLAPFAVRAQGERAAYLARLTGALGDADEEAREAAVDALATSLVSGALTAAAARPLLLAAARDTASSVRAAASLALGALAANTPNEASSAGAATIVGAAQREGAANVQRVQVMAPAATDPTRNTAAQTAFQRLTLLGATWLRQTRIIRREVWLVMVCGALAAVALTLAIHLKGGVYDYAAAVAFTLSGASAFSVSFLAQAEHDPGLELTLATPTSLRFVLGGRIALVIGYNFALAVVASLVIALVSGQSAQAIIQGWIGPLLLLTAVTLAVSLALGSASAVWGALLLDTTQLLRALPTQIDGAPAVANALGALRLAVGQVWGAHAATLILVAALILAVALLAPQRALKHHES